MWYYVNGPVKMGPVGVEKLARYIRKDSINLDGLVKGPGVDEWTKLRDVQETILQACPAPDTLPSWNGSFALCISIGTLLVLVGGYFLLIAPRTFPNDAALILTLQPLAIGISGAIAGAVFIAAGIRPRL